MDVMCPALYVQCQRPCILRLSDDHEDVADLSSVIDPFHTTVSAMILAATGTVYHCRPGLQP